MANADVEALLAAIRDEQVPIRDAPEYYPMDIELALIDAVLSIQARYGKTEDVGVRRSIRRYKENSGRNRWNDLSALAAHTHESLEAVLDNRQKTGGVPKVAAIISAADRLASIGVVSAADVEPASREQKDVYTGVRGLGPITWEYFLMGVGHDGVKADTLVSRLVCRAVGRKLSPKEVAEIVAAAARELGVSATALDFSIWRHMSAPRND